MWGDTLLEETLQEALLEEQQQGLRRRRRREDGESQGRKSQGATPLRNSVRRQR